MQNHNKRHTTVYRHIGKKLPQRFKTAGGCGPYQQLEIDRFWNDLIDGEEKLSLDVAVIGGDLIYLKQNLVF